MKHRCQVRGCYHDAVIGVGRSPTWLCARHYDSWQNRVDDCHEDALAHLHAH